MLPHFLIWAVTTLPALGAQAEENAEAWDALRDGQAVLMMRHALAPGTGDPDNFDLDDCNTQRNLSEEGRAQARAWQPLLNIRGISEARVFSSQWCRSMETATAMDIGDVKAWPSLNSFFSNRGDGAAQKRALIALVNELEQGLPVILVSHQVNITALTDVFPSSNEGLILALPLSENPEVLAHVTPGD
ncbi:histidine phosphatase family protein [Hydrocarboniclastica marina]|uniref:Histidine phosphatase family protein n=1 Tax=Hydrocarboniclastica marina TaxID=2259620 RepID=A0A4P7XLC2_9ALTE|nr:histidine phosphatase family protein [Hydrocarboniclastica marina]